MKLRFLIAALALFTTACTQARADRLSSEPPIAFQAANSTNHFAIDLLKQGRGNKANTFASPYSISAALSMTWAGAGGVTADQMRKVMHFLPAERQHLAMEVLANMLANRGDKKVSFTVANRLWGQKSLPFHAAFLNTVKKHYGADLARVDFGQSETQRKAINRWVETHTRDLIKNLLKPGDIDSSTRLVLTNAIAFEGTWKYAFAAKDTHNMAFWAGGVTSKTAPTMFRHFKGNETVRWAKRGDHQLLELPYGNGSAVMTILLPNDRNGLDKLVAGLTPASFQAPSRTIKGELDVFLPKFTITHGQSLAKTLANMGMASAFGAGADFSKMSNAGLFISDVIHKAFVEVDEKGTKAAAATAVVMTESARMPPPQFKADRPFVFAIRDAASGTILFSGTVKDPQ